ncbi:MAG: helix-turn-helix transcriptional regulator [Clostridia bacterium]|nr:helix-turn-helix transcriptional regulator [Clostridia bacterium]
MLTDELTNFCESIRCLRKQHKLSLTATAQRLGISVKTLKSIEQGIFPPRLSVRVIMRAQQCFDIPAKDLFSPRKK